MAQSKTSNIVIGLFSTAIVFLNAVAHAEGKYKTVVIKDRQSEATVTKPPSAIEIAIEKHVIEELGDQPVYKSGGKRVLSVNLIEQVAGPNAGKFLLDLSYVSDPALIGPKNVTKDGLVIDAMRIISAISKDKKVKAAKIAEVMLRPHVFVAGGSLEQLIKIQIDLSALKGPKWDGVTGMYFEELVRQSGQLNISPYLIHNGGKFLILKPEQLDL